MMDYLSTVILIGVSLALLTMLTFFTKKPFNNINFIVILFMGALVSPMLTKLLSGSGIVSPFRVLEFFRAAPLTFGPLLYFYARAETGDLETFRYRDSLHLLPFAAAAIISIIIFQPGPGFSSPGDTGFGNMPPAQAGFHVPGAFPGDMPGSPHPSGFNSGRHPEGKSGLPVPFIMIYISLAVYTILIFRIIRKHNRIINDYFSSDTIEISLKWIKWITFCFMLSYMLVLAAGLMDKYNEKGHSDLMFAVPDFATTFFIFMFSFFSMKQPVLYRDKGEDDPAEAGISRPEKRYEKSGLKKDTAEKYYERIVQFMGAEKPYTDPGLTINYLSEKLEIPRHHITQVINEQTGRNFFMFVNEYRINEVKEKIHLDAAGENTILRIAYDAGFNSKSSFNTMFKKNTGMTPSQYRKTVCIDR